MGWLSIVFICTTDSSPPHKILIYCGGEGGGGGEESVEKGRLYVVLQCFKELNYMQTSISQIALSKHFQVLSRKLAQAEPHI